MKHYYTLIVFLVVFFQGYGQVSEIEKQIELEKASRTSESGAEVEYLESDSEVDPVMVLDAFLFMIETTAFIFVEGQNYVRENQNDHPHLFAFEASIQSGQDFKRLSTLTRPHVRLNLGLFSSDLQFSHINDFSGRLSSWDWQVLGIQFPTSFIDLKASIGFIHVPEFDVSYFESAGGIGINIAAIKTVISANYRASSRTSLGSRYRKMIDIRIDYQLYQNQKMRISPALGFSRESYFANTHFSFFKAGIVFRWY